jgi:hypothetical protein
MNTLSPELTQHVLQPAMHEKILLRAAELIALGVDATDRRPRRHGPEGSVDGAPGHHVVRRGGRGSCPP